MSGIKFNPGSVVATPGALEAFRGHGVMSTFFSYRVANQTICPAAPLLLELCRSNPSGGCPTFAQALILLLRGTGGIGTTEAEGTVPISNLRLFGFRKQKDFHNDD
jgi:hypothetical protein